MDITSYVETVRAGIRNAAALADDQTKQVADHLGSAVEASSRLALIQALGDAAAEITVDLAPGSVDLRITGTEPMFVVTLPTAAGDAGVTTLMPAHGGPETSAAPPEPSAPEGEEQQARISLRLPQTIKDQVDEQAAADGVSTNTWLLHRVLEALADRGAGGRRSNRGWGINIGMDGVRLNMPPTPPLPPRFGPGFPFAADGPRPGRDTSGRSRRGDRGQQDPGSGAVQGWVK